MRPELVAQIGFTEWTRDGKLRHPRYQGLRTDKDAGDVVQGDPLMPRIEVEVTHPERVLFPDPDGITKRDLVDYYCEVADTMLPHLKDRPLNVQRFPRGIDEQGLRPAGFRRFAHRVDEPRRGRQGGRHRGAPGRRTPRGTGDGWPTRTASHCTSGSRGGPTAQPRPTGVRPRPVRQRFRGSPATARAVAGVLDDLGLACYVQTTGSRGLHVVVPLRADTDFDTARQFARDVAEVVVADDPAHRTVEARKNKRGGRVYLDIMRNAYAQTAVAPYSVRARRGAPVATPLEWDELDSRGLRQTVSPSVTSRSDSPGTRSVGRHAPGMPAH